MADILPDEQFGSSKLIKEPKAKILHFKPNPETGRDKFGNRIFTSPEFAYQDREHHLNKAGLLVSQEGEVFIKSHPGLLKNLDHTLVVAQKDNDPNKEYHLGENIILYYLAKDNQSLVYK